MQNQRLLVQAHGASPLAQRAQNVPEVDQGEEITGTLVGVQPFGGFGMSGTDSKAGGPDYLLLHMLAKTVVERF